jgi:hypothetical protein
MGAWLARQRPGVQEIRISYSGGWFYSLEPRQFRRSTSPQGPIRLYQYGGELVLDLPWPARRPCPPTAAMATARASITSISTMSGCLRGRGGGRNWPLA